MLRILANMRKMLRWVAVLSLIVALVACGSGGTSSNSNNWDSAQWDTARWQ